MTFPSDPRQDAYAEQRFYHTTLFRAWFREWSDYEAVWLRVICEPEDIKDVHSDRTA
jgi:hypothetical protein